ncbi:MAG: protein kinase [Bacteroides sp.]|nr:protein kinase [Bacteroides sp.]
MPETPLFLEEYVKLRKLGQGSFASVYKVRHNDLGYIRAIKVSNELVADASDQSYQTFLNECRVLLKIGNGCHPNIVRIYQPRLISNKAIVEMDYIDGLSLAKYIEKERFISYDEFKRFALQIVGAMAYCHADLYQFLMDPDADELPSDPSDGTKYLITSEIEQKLRKKYCVNHNDLHSNNIMRRNYDGSFVLLDFGLAIQDNHCVKTSSRGDGAYEYCSPEKLDGKEITSASDVYSLGILLYEMLAGQVPFVMQTQDVSLEKSRFDVYNRQLNETPAPIEPLRAKAFQETHPGETYQRDYPEALDKIILRCLEKKPAYRYPDAKALLADLEKAFDTDNQQLSQPNVEIPRTAAAIEEATPDETYIELLNAVKDKQVESVRLNGELQTAKDRIITLEVALSNATTEIEGLRNRSAASLQSSERGASLIFSIVSLVILLASIGLTVWQCSISDYFRSSDALIDRIAICGGCVSALALLVTSLLKRPPMVMWCISIMLMALTATLQLTTSFGSDWPLVTGVMSFVSMIFLMIAWFMSIKREKIETGNNGEVDSNIQMSEIVE